MVLEEHHPSPHRGVEGSQRTSVDRLTLPYPRPPASPSEVEGQSSWRAGTQQLSWPPPRAPLRKVPTWADIARGSPAPSKRPPLSPQLRSSPSTSAALPRELSTFFCKKPRWLRKSLPHMPLNRYGCHVPTSCLTSPAPAPA
jgi:hypothetical protein